MNFLKEVALSVQQTANNDFSLLALKSFLIIWAVLIILTALSTNNKWVLSGILAYELLP